MRRKKKHDLNYALRQFLNEWRLAILNKFEQKCSICGFKRKGKIHVHHLIPFHFIRDGVFNELQLSIRTYIEDYTPEEIALISAKLIEKHCDVEGVTIHKKIHKLFHKLYGYDATRENYEEFKTRWDNGEWSGKIKYL
jgi:hypothetical protein